MQSTSFLYILSVETCKAIDFEFIFQRKSLKRDEQVYLFIRWYKQKKNSDFQTKQNFKWLMKWVALRDKVEGWAKTVTKA